MSQNKNRCLTQSRLLYSELNTMDLVAKKNKIKQNKTKKPTKYLFLTVLIAETSKIKAPANPGEVLLLGLQMAIFWLCSHLAGRREREREKQALPSFYKGSKLHSSGVYPRKLITAKAQCSNTIILGVRISTYELGGEHKHLNPSLSGLIFNEIKANICKPIKTNKN